MNRFESSIEVKTATLTPVSNTETTAVEVTAPDITSTEVVSLSGNTQATLLMDFTIGSLTKVQVRIYGDVDPGAAPTYYPETVSSVAGGSGVTTLYPRIIELTSTGQYAFHFAIGAYRRVKVTAQSVGTTTNSSLKVTLGLKTN